MHKILIVEDDPSIRQLLEMTFTHSGLSAICAEGVAQAKDALQTGRECALSLAVVDVGLRDGLGYELIPLLQKASIPFLFLTARGHLSEKLYGIELGADDYVVKPFEPLELVARIKMILRRLAPEQQTKRTFGELTVNTQSRTVTLAGKDISLAPKEFELLAHLTEAPGQAFTRDQLLEAVWGYDACGSARTVDTHILGLRQKLGNSWIKTVYKVGYSFQKDGGQ